MQNETYLRTKQAMEYLQISRTKLWELCKSGILKPVKLGRKVLLFPVQELQAFAKDAVAGKYETGK